MPNYLILQLTPLQQFVQLMTPEGFEPPTPALEAGVLSQTTPKSQSTKFQLTKPTNVNMIVNSPTRNGKESRS